MAIVARARAMRKALTPPEARLWVQLKLLRAQGFHFRRQAPFRGYYLDFVCFERRLVVEVDGVSHATDAQALKDRVRDAVLAGEGFMTLRFDNAAVRDDLDGLMRGILGELEARPTRSLRDHPPHEGEGEG
ncbi:MAG: endonuclease domain-containing protein [Bordetella sp.]|nr:endonuclease domain-containing protein [Bordetella sp.]